MATADGAVPFSIQVGGSEQLRALSKQLKNLGDEGKKLRKDLNQAIKDASQPVISAVQEAIRSQTFESTGTRVTAYEGYKFREETKNEFRAANRHGHSGAVHRSAEAGRQAKLRAIKRKGSSLGTAEKARLRAERMDHSLREDIARSVKVSIKQTGVAIVVPKSAVEGFKNAPKDTNSSWRHPVFGDKNNAWVTQRGGNWFDSTIRDKRDEFRQAIADAMQKTLDEITTE